MENQGFDKPTYDDYDCKWSDSRCHDWFFEETFPPARDVETGTPKSHFDTYFIDDTLGCDQGGQSGNGNNCEF